jgi:N6-adenosine-specific RNA methylase IME4
MNRPSIVSSLETLVETQMKFRTVYADPPWAYSNRASRGAASNHYSTLDIGQICAEPVADLITDNAHLHLWTTNAFLRDAFTVIEAWVSHEFLLLGVRGSSPFEDKTCRSWLLNRRTRHSKKPFAFRRLIEKVSPGPYLELYGREEQPRTEWTVYGNQVERKLF